MLIGLQSVGRVLGVLIGGSIGRVQRPWVFRGRDRGNMVVSVILVMCGCSWRW